MKYFKNTELARLYAISHRTPLLWIRAAQAGKNDLQLHEVNNKVYIADTTKNQATIRKLIARGKKHRSRGFKVVSPSQAFYQLYSRKQVFDIVSSLDIHREIPRQYNYFDGGAENWDKYAQRLWQEEAANMLNSTVRLLDFSKEQLRHLLEQYDRVNVIDLGVGNCLPIKEFLTYLIHEEGVLGRYIAIDISPKMLEIARANLTQWFGDEIRFEAHTRDVNKERFNDLLVEESIGDDAGRVLNLVLFLGGTLSNMRSPDDTLRVIYNSMGRNDLLLYTSKLDTEASRRYFDFGSGAESSELSANHRFILDLLNIDQSLYDVEMGYDDTRRQRYIRVRLKVEVTIDFDFGDGKHRKLELRKGDAVLLWRSRHQTALDTITQLDRSGFALQNCTVTDEQFVLTISSIDTSK